MKRLAITGAAGGIGKATATILSQRGHSLLLIDRSEAELKILADEFNAEYAVVSENGLTAAKNALATSSDGLKGLIHLAGTMEDDPNLAATEGVWQRTMQNNLDNAYDFATAIEPYMPDDQSGRLVFTSSLAFRRGAVDAVAYSAAKGGLVGLTRALARRFKTKAVVNAIAPGIIKTSMPKDVIARRGEMLKKEIPLGRFGEPEEVARVIAFLVSDDASYMTGQCLNIDGGQIMT